jgi:predicted metalloprotease
VMLGQTRIVNELQVVNHRGWGGITVAGIMAHEFAHIYQFSTQYRQRLRELDDTVKPVELHADFLAGYHLGLKRRSGASMDIGAWMDGAYLLGDENYELKEHHGTPKERQRAVREGYRTGVEGHQPASVAAEIGYNTIREIMQMNF